MIVAGIDAGGTSWKLMVAGDTGGPLARTSIPTTTPDETVSAAADWINALRSDGHDIAAIGLASFGPIDRDPGSKTYGLLGDTPKPGWRGANPRQMLVDATGLPIALDTDVNGALLAEVEWGAGASFSDVAYVTVGAGVGGAALVTGNLVGAPGHGEFGHLRPARSEVDLQRFAGACPFHGDCIEGLASATAIAARWGKQPDQLPDDHECWPLAANALAQLCVSIAYLIAPQRIILGGGVMQRDILLTSIRTEFSRLVNGYTVRAEMKHAETYLAPPLLGADAGAMGGVYLAQRAARMAASE